MTLIQTIQNNILPIIGIVVFITVGWILLRRLKRKKRDKVSPEVQQVPVEDNFMKQLKNYIIVARKQKYTDEEIINNFKEKGYTQQMINEAFGLKSLPELPIVPTKQLPTFTRIGQGFKVMGSKIANSNYVQEIQAEQQTARDDEFLPSEFISNKRGKEEDTFSTNFSRLTRVDL